jgi:hypothetical protein
VHTSLNNVLRIDSFYVILMLRKLLTVEGTRVPWSMFE